MLSIIATPIGPSTNSGQAFPIEFYPTLSSR